MTHTTEDAAGTQGILGKPLGAGENEAPKGDGLRDCEAKVNFSHAVDLMV
jgi:hypothetical protein